MEDNDNSENSNDEKNKITQDPEEIKKWAEDRGGQPAKVKGISNPSLLRISFPDGRQDNLENISWDEFFQGLKQQNLAFMYEEETKDGEPSTFFKMVDAQEAAGSSA